MSGTKSNRSPSAGEDWTDEDVEAALVDFFQSETPAELLQPLQKLNTVAARPYADIRPQDSRAGFVSLVAVSAVLLIAVTSLFNSNSSQSPTSSPLGLNTSPGNLETQPAKSGPHGVVNRDRRSSDRLLPADLWFLPEYQSEYPDKSNGRPDKPQGGFFPDIEVFPLPLPDEGRGPGVKTGKKSVPRKP